VGIIVSGFSTTADNFSQPPIPAGLLLRKRRILNFKLGATIPMQG
jgi:hypothetical protein